MVLDAAATDDPRSRNTAIGRVVSVKGSIVMLELRRDGGVARNAPPRGAEIGSLVRIETGRTIVFGMVASVEAPSPTGEGDHAELWLASLELVGESVRQRDGALGAFHRGVTHYPTIGNRAASATREDLACVYHVGDDATVTVGSLFQDSSLPAKFRINDLLGKHFAVLGTTGTGKSCTVALLLQSILERCPHAHILLLDAHAEYAAAFGDQAEIITYRDLKIPFWVLTFEELVEVLITDKEGYKTEIEALADLVRQAKAMYRVSDLSGEHRRRAYDVAAFSEDAPLPYRIADLLGLIDDRLGALQHQNDITMYRRLRSRIDARIRDERYAFMFGPEAAHTKLEDVFSRLFRLPVDGKPLAILELTGLPSEVLSVMVSVTSRLAFDFGIRGDGKVPITYICEEAHKYIPADPKLGFEPARRSIARVAKEGRKYGVSLGIVTQRPSELDATIFSQCNTMISMRLTSDRDQEIVRCAVSDGAASLIRFLPSLVAGEAIAFGDGVALPLRLRFRPLEAMRRPASASADFESGWSEDWAEETFAKAVAERCSRASPLCENDAQARGAPYIPERRTVEQAMRAPQPAATQTATAPAQTPGQSAEPAAPQRPAPRFDPEVERQIARQIAPKPFTAPQRPAPQARGETDTADAEKRSEPGFGRRPVVRSD